MSAMSSSFSHPACRAGAGIVHQVLAQLTISLLQVGKIFKGGFLTFALLPKRRAIRVWGFFGRINPEVECRVDDQG
jgi:hypothetical protein